MKFQYIFAVTGVVVCSMNMAWAEKALKPGAVPCEIVLTPSPLIDAETALEARYIRQAMTHKRNFDKDVDPRIDTKPLNSRKLKFIRERNDLLQRMIGAGELTMDDLRDSWLFRGELYSNGQYTQYGWILFLENKILAFPFDNVNKYEDIFAQHFGFLHPRLNMLRLDGEYMLTLTPEGAEITNADRKDPALIRPLADESDDPRVKEFIHGYHDELVRLLVTTRFKLSDLVDGLISPAKVVETGDDIFLIFSESGKDTFYVTKSPNAIRTGETVGVLNGKATQIGFLRDLERTLVFTDGSRARVVNGVLIPESLNTRVASPGRAAEPTTAEDKFRAAYDMALTDLLNQGILSRELSELSSLNSVRHAITGESYMIVKTRQGYLAFSTKLPKGWAYLRDLDKNYPVRWLANDHALVVRETIGFRRTIVEEWVK